MRVLLDHRRQAIERRVADIRVFAKLHPRPSVQDVVNGDEFSGKRLRSKRRVELWRDADRGGGSRNLPHLTLGISRSPNPVPQRRGGEVFAIGKDARIEVCHAACLAIPCE